MLSFCQPRDLHLTSIAPHAARACLGTVSAPFFWCFRQARNYTPGQAYWNQDGIISDQGNRTLLPRVPPDLVLICGRSQAALRGTPLGYGSWSEWAYYSLGSRSPCRGHSVLPLPCENRRLSMGFCCDYFFQFEHTDGLCGSVQASIFLVLLQVGMTGDSSLLVVQDTLHELTLQPHQRATA